MSVPEYDRANRQGARWNLSSNVLLMGVKLGIGIVGHSQALIADGLHSGADVFSSVAVVIGLAVSGRPPDRDHHYGHAKAEAISQKVVAVFLLLAGLEVANTAISSFSRRGPVPSLLTLWIALAAGAFKVIMMWTQRRLAKKTGSHGILASAVDNQMDAVSSFVAAVGIGASRMGYLSGDSVAALVVASLVMWGGVEIFRTAAIDLMDPAADAETQEAIRKRVAMVAGVRSISLLRTRVNGALIFVDVEIEVDRHLTLLAAHDIAHRVDRSVCELSRVQGVTVHVNPMREDG